MSVTDDLRDRLDQADLYDGTEFSSGRAAETLIAEGYRKMPSKEALEAVIDKFDDDMAEGHCDCGNYRNDTDELLRRLLALMQ